MQGALTVRVVRKNDSFQHNSPRIALAPGKKYRLRADITCLNAERYCAYVAAILIGPDGKERTRIPRWIDETRSDGPYTIVFTSPPEPAEAVIALRVNRETPLSGDVVLDLPDLQSLALEEAHPDEPDQSDSITDYELPGFAPLTDDEENLLEANSVWIFGTPRSGTTWLGGRLLQHPEHILWHEPYIGDNLGTYTTVFDYQAGQPRLTRMSEVHRHTPHYFFSPHHRNAWLPMLRKLLLARTYSQARTLTKKVIAKEPNGCQAADVIMECLPTARFILLLRDGRDVVESSLACHGKDTWAQLPPLEAPQARREAVRQYSLRWGFFSQILQKAYDAHDPALRLLVRYEELRDDTSPHLRRIYDFIGTSISDGQLRDLVEAHDFRNIPASQKGPGKFNRAASTGGWRSTFSREEQDLMNSVMAETLEAMGYTI